jgi:hypothetical protein
MAKFDQSFIEVKFHLLMKDIAELECLPEELSDPESPLLQRLIHQFLLLRHKKGGS